MVEVEVEVPEIDEAEEEAEIEERSGEAAEMEGADGIMSANWQSFPAPFLKQFQAAVKPR